MAPHDGSTISYKYDFGDNWTHDIVVEAVLPPEDGSELPRCTGGRRAAPPEDSGGVWGYAELLEVLADPNDPEYLDRLDWLGIDDPSEFDPTQFDPQAVTERLRLHR